MLFKTLRDCDTLNSAHCRSVGYVTIGLESLGELLSLFTSYWLRDSVGYEFHDYSLGFKLGPTLTIGLDAVPVAAVVLM